MKENIIKWEISLLLVEVKEDESSKDGAKEAGRKEREGGVRKIGEKGGATV